MLWRNAIGFIVAVAATVVCFVSMSGWEQWVFSAILAPSAWVGAMFATAKGY